MAIEKFLFCTQHQLLAFDQKYNFSLSTHETKSFHIKLIKSIESMQLRLYCRSILEIGFAIKNAALFRLGIVLENPCFGQNSCSRRRCMRENNGNFLHDKVFFPLHLYFNLFVLYILQQFFFCSSSPSPPYCTNCRGNFIIFY